MSSSLLPARSPLPASSAALPEAGSPARPRAPLRLALLLAVLAMAVYAAFAGPRLASRSTDPHFVLQAEAWLQGQLELTRRPPHGNDWASYQELALDTGEVVRGVYRSPGRGNQARRFQTLQGRLLLIEPQGVRSSRTHTFVSFPSFPAVLMLPGVAIWGERFNDVLFTVVVGGLDVGLVFLLLELLVARGHSRRTRRENLALTGLFAFGTVQLWCAVLGQVWFTALEVGVGLHLLYLLAALDARQPLAAGCCLALALATRTPLAFVAPFFLLQLLWPGAGRPAWPTRSQWRSLLLFAAPLLVVGGALMALNYARFARPFEFGHSYLAGGTIERIRDHGLFGLNFLGVNLAAALLLLPKVVAHAPYLQFSRHGMSLLLSTPPLALLFGRGRPPARPEEQGLRRALLVSLVAVALPLALYQNTGHIQYGYRFSLDFWPLLLALFALRLRRLGPAFWVLAGLGVLVNAFGAVTFKRFEGFYDDHFLGWPW